MGNFKLVNTPLPGLVIVEPVVYADDRGFLLVSHNTNSFADLGLNVDFFQDNHSRSKKGVIRGLHYQINPSPMGKLVRTVTGKIFDVGVDIRQGSPTFGQWYGIILSGENHKMLYLPPGFAHGFLVLEDNSDVLYKCSGVYSPKDERSIIWNDPTIGIVWPLDQIEKVIISAKDQKAPELKTAETNFIYNHVKGGV